MPYPTGWGHQRCPGIRAPATAPLTTSIGENPATDATDAEAAARAVLNGQATGAPKSGDGQSNTMLDSPPLGNQGPYPWTMSTTN